MDNECRFERERSDLPSQRNQTRCMVLEVPPALCQGRKKGLYCTRKVSQDRAIPVLLHIAFDPPKWKLQSQITAMASWPERLGTLKETSSDMFCAVRVEGTDESRAVTAIRKNATTHPHPAMEA